MTNKIRGKAARLLKEVAEYLVTEPEGYDQGVYKDDQSSSPCGTACCIAGTLVMIDNPKKYMRLGSGDMSYEARKLLGLRSVATLFATADNWPSPFAEQYEAAASQYDRAKVGAARIRYFIRTGV